LFLKPLQIIQIYGQTHYYFFTILFTYFLKSNPSTSFRERLLKGKLIIDTYCISLTIEITQLENYRVYIHQTSGKNGRVVLLAMQARISLLVYQTLKPKTLKQKSSIDVTSIKVVSDYSNIFFD